MPTKQEGPAQEPQIVGGEQKCKNCDQPKSAHFASGHIYCPNSLGGRCWYEPDVPATPAPSQPAGAREWTLPEISGLALSAVVHSPFYNAVEKQLAQALIEALRENAALKAGKE